MPTRLFGGIKTLNLKWGFSLGGGQIKETHHQNKTKKRS
jgi:hypothetical protein